MKPLWEATPHASSPAWGLAAVIARRTGVLTERDARTESFRRLTGPAGPVVRYRRPWSLGRPVAAGLYRRPRRLADTAIDGQNAGYVNTGFIGLSLAAKILGARALAHLRKTDPSAGHPHREVTASRPITIR